jgi:hypothetical protein
VLFSVDPSSGPPRSPRSFRAPEPEPETTRPKWPLIVQYFIASAFCLVFLGLLLIDPFLPEYDVPMILYLFMLVVIAFALPGSEKIATTLINALFRRKPDL